MSVMEVQHGGDHYKGVPTGYQPIEIAEKLGLSATEFSVLKYLLRYKKKSGLVDLKKMMHFGQMLIKMHYGVETTLEYQETASESGDSWKAVEAERKVADGVRGISPLKDALDALRASVPPAQIGKLWSSGLPVEVLLTPAGSMGSSVEDQRQYLREALGVQAVPHAPVVETEQKVADGMHGISPFEKALDASVSPAHDEVAAWCGALLSQPRPVVIGEMKPDLDGREDMLEPVNKGGPGDHLLPEKRDYPGPSPAEIEDYLLLPELVTTDEVPVVVDDGQPF